MERREQYDPEDIESLLYERSFDDLLEEERAYVLRHLSDRAEYEAMRTLLLDLRADDAQAPPLEPLPSVRANVMEAFRAQRQPQWRIWLNSIGGLLVPIELPRLWRPALAFASLALLIVVAVWFIRGDGLAGGQELAELKKQEAPVRTENEPITTSDTAKEDVPNTVAPAMKEVPVAQVTVLDDTQEEVESTNYSGDNAEMVASPTMVPEDEKLVVHSSDNVKEEVDGVQSFNTATAPGRVIPMDELSRNQTLANTEVRVAAAKERSKVASAPTTGRSLAQDRELASLLAAGW